MGVLIAMCYPAGNFADLADHTYVMCGTGGKAWSCWGGKTGGAQLRRGEGSTKQADAIAELNERAGITCYLINGVCHQAANRILFPAKITVGGARGYDVSEALYGTYGRLSGPLGTCKAPFNQYDAVTGDLPECIGPPIEDFKKGFVSLAVLDLEKKYLKGVLDIYDRVKPMKMSLKGLDGLDLENFQLELFMYKAQYNLGSKLDEPLSKTLEDIRRSTEQSRMKIDNLYAKEGMKPSEFVKAINDETIAFQEKMANAIKPDVYEALFGLKPGDSLILADPEIIKSAYVDK
jgi:hypothetical protein